MYNMSLRLNRQNSCRATRRAASPRRLKRRADRSCRVPPLGPTSDCRGTGGLPNDWRLFQCSWLNLKEAVKQRPGGSLNHVASLYYTASFRFRRETAPKQARLPLHGEPRPRLRSGSPKALCCGSNLTAMGSPLVSVCSGVARFGPPDGRPRSTREPWSRGETRGRKLDGERSSNMLQISHS